MGRHLRHDPGRRDCWSTEGPSLTELLEVIDRTEERLREGNLAEGYCWRDALLWPSRAYNAGKSRKPQIGACTEMALILFIEYHVAFRQAASYLMNQQPDLKLVSQVGSVREERERMAEGE